MRIALVLAATMPLAFGAPPAAAQNASATMFPSGEKQLLPIP